MQRKNKFLFIHKFHLVFVKYLHCYILSVKKYFLKYKIPNKNNFSHVWALLDLDTSFLYIYYILRLYIRYMCTLLSENFILAINIKD